jgi:hypothetical protein
MTTIRRQASNADMKNVKKLKNSVSNDCRTTNSEYDLGSEQRTINKRANQ